LEQLSLPANGYDIVCCTNALDHVEDVEAALQEIKRVVIPDGVLLLTVDVFANEMLRNVGHPYSFTFNELFQLLRRCGFRVEWRRLSRKKLGMMTYAEYRLQRKMTDQAILLKAAQEQLRSYAKQLLRRGALGELLLVAHADKARA
jgi:SAM-dependent methyltransferase